jgi:GrpB-like predicted nucleotidyltransferase (UPF0157 family)
MSIKNIEVVPYNPEWPKMFGDEAELIQHSIGKNYIAIHHVGSTSVPGLAAKPKIDIILVVKDAKNSIINLESIGYQYKGEYNIPFHFGFSKRGDVDVNLHVYEEGNPEIELNLLFSDYLCNNPQALNEYAQLKAYLLTQPASFEKNNSKFTGYNLGKDNFIRKILQAAGFDKLRIHHCTHYEEWEAAKCFRQKYFDKVLISDPYAWTFNHPEHVHIVLYHGTIIIGYAHLQLWPEFRSAIRILLIDESWRNQNFGGQFLILCEKWLKTKKYKSLHTVSSPKTYPFYKKRGYNEMAFNDPAGYVSDSENVPIGKIL